MTRTASLQAIAATLLACGLSAAPAQAGPNRTFVSGKGTDSGACTRALPCKTFAFAITVTNAGGEIDVLDPAGYGAVTIAKAIGIVNDGVGTAGITATGGFGTFGVLINAGPSDSVHLRGLTIEGLGSGGGGIQFHTGGNLAIENCVIRDFVGAGIGIVPGTATSTPISFSVSNTIASNNGIDGIVLSGNGGPITGVLSNVLTNNNGYGIAVSTTGGSLNVTIVDSEASNNGNFGILAGAAFGNGPTAVMARNVVASNNKTGLEADGLGGGVILRVAHSVVTGNGTGVNTSGGKIQSYGDNDIDGNTTNNMGVLTTIPTH